MTDPAAATPQQPDAEDRKWAAALDRSMRFTFRQRTAQTQLLMKAVEAIAARKLWRLDRLLTTGFSYGFGRHVRIGALEYPSQLTGYNTPYADRKRASEIMGRERYDLFVTLAGDIGWTEGVQRLLQLGGSPYTVSERYPRDYFGLVSALADRGRTDILLPLLAREQVPSDRDRGGLLGEVLRVTVLNNRLDILKTVAATYPEVLNATASVRAETYPYRGQPHSALDLVTKRRVAPEISAYIVEQRKEAEKEKISSGNALSFAISSGNEPAAIALLNAGAPVDRYASGYSPLVSAARQDMPQLITLLLDQGAGAAFRDTIGADLLAKAFIGNNTPQGTTDWSAVAKTADVILQRLPVTAGEIRDLMSKVPAYTVAYETLKTHLQAREQAGAAVAWQQLGPSQAGTVAIDTMNGLQLTDIYNFATREHMTLSRNLVTKTDTLLLRETFAEAKNQQAIRDAEKFLVTAAKPAAPKIAA